MLQALPRYRQVARHRRAIAVVDRDAGGHHHPATPSKRGMVSTVGSVMPRSVAVAEANEMLSVFRTKASVTSEVTT